MVLHQGEQPPLSPALAGEIERAAAILRAGGLVAFPTETVYGLGADATSDTAVARIFAAKGRPQFNPLIVHGATAGTVLALVTTGGAAGAAARRLAEAFWPGPLTLVLPRAGDCRASLLCSAGLDSLAIRVPSHPVAQALLAATGRPVAAPSANRSGHVSATEAAHVHADLGEGVDMVLDAGAAPLGVESTVIDLTAAAPTLLRPGAITREAAEAALKAPLALGGVAVNPGGPIPVFRSPGMLSSHYAPALPVRLIPWGQKPQPAIAGEALLSFGLAAAPEGFAAHLPLSPSGNPLEAAARLFSALRSLDALARSGAKGGAGGGVTGVAAMLLPDNGIGHAINDRLKRAAAPR